MATGEYFSVLLSFSLSYNLTAHHPHIFYRRDGVRMPPTPKQVLFFNEYDDPRAYMHNRSHRINTFDRAGNNHRMVKSSQADKAHFDRHMMRGTRFQDMHSDESESYVYSTDGPHQHTSSSSSGRWSNSPGERHDHTLSPQRDSDRNLGHTSRRISHSKSRTPPRHESSRLSHTLSLHQTLATTPSHDLYGGDNYNYHVSPHDPTSPAGGHHRLGSGDSHRKGSSTAYSGRQGSRGQSSSRNHSSSSPSVCSLSHTDVTSTHQSPLRSTSTVSTSNLQTPLTSNVLPKENRGYAAGAAAAAAAAAAVDVDSRDASSHHSNRTNLGPAQQWSPISNNEWSDGDSTEDSSEAEQSVPEQIKTSGQGANDVSPEGLTTGASYHTAQSRTTNNDPSIVSELLYQPTQTRTSARLSKGRHRFREGIDL
jgi:hypothetical protein